MEDGRNRLVFGELADQSGQLEQSDARPRARCRGAIEADRDCSRH